MGKIIGIDLGTTNSVVAVMEGESPVVIINEEGGRTTPSVVNFGKDGVETVGTVARRKSITEPTRTVYSAKRFIGLNYAEAANEAKLVPYKVVRSGDLAKIDVDGREYSPPEISAKVLQKLKRDAERYLGEAVTEAVITVPAYFNDSQRLATKDAGRIAGLDVKRIINEPTAAALAYGFNKKEEQTIVVYDFGGGTFDISVLEVGDGIVEVKSTSGDTHLGGDDIDHTLMEWMIAEFKNETGIDLSAPSGMPEMQRLQARSRLKEAAEKAKIELSSSQTTQISLPFLAMDAEGAKHLERTLSRARFEQMIQGIVDRTLEPCKKALADAKLKTADISEVILVGGSTRIPLVREAVKKYFGKEPNHTVNPDEVVAVGAAVQGGVFAGDVRGILLIDVTPLSLGIETMGGVMTLLIPRNTKIPYSKSDTFSTAADGQTAVDVQVFQGERQMARDNRKLGDFRLDGIASAPRGVPQIEVTFDLDANGILNVRAKDKATGREQKITITASSGLPKDEVERLVNEAAANEAGDKARREMVEERNRLDNLVYQIGKGLQENRDKLAPADVTALEDALAEGRSALDSDKVDVLRTASGKLEQAASRLNAAGAPDAGGPQGRGPDDVVDAEFTES